MFLRLNIVNVNIEDLIQFLYVGQKDEILIEVYRLRYKFGFKVESLRGFILKRNLNIIYSFFLVSCHVLLK